MAALLDNAREAHHEALARAEVAADRAILESLIDGTGDLLSEETFPRLEPMFSKYAVGSDMYALLEQAATAFSDAAEELAAWVLAGRVVDEARRN
ncbi:MAG: hypothetical protein EOO27_03095 [Comamonadaceae bacterium]|nr:MAG: hypothetical protein EOO27_03095 [Comamonadaceae bacterium]